MKKSALLVAISAVVASLSGCASVAVSDKAIEKNTAAALGVGENTFTVSNREDNGVKTTYLVTKNSGQKYTCYVTGSVSVVGRTVSDAMCQQIGKADSPARTAKDSASPSCNALLKAAGRC